MSDLSLLLEELKEVDSETWKEINNISPHFQYRNDCIQGCIQRACFERKWYITLEILPFETDDVHKWRAQITQYNGRTTGYDNLTDTPAVALLAAYNEAVRASSG